MTERQDCDLLIVGGGINGAGIARDAAGRGLKVVLCEQDDLAHHTSSASTKLIHGGLRYLEHYEFALVRKSLREREVLLGIAPHIIQPLRFILPHVRQLRPAWMIRSGLFLYDHLGGRRKLPASQGVRLREHPAGEPLRPGLTKGFAYSDCWVQDARLVVLNAMDAAERGAAILPRTRCTAAQREQDGWTVTLQSTIDGRESRVRARAIVNAAGPWASRFLDDRLGMHSDHDVQLVKGSHIVVPRLYKHDNAYIFQHTDGRIVFAIPYERDFTLIGTTDVAYTGDPSAAEASTEEVQYLCDAVNAYFATPVRPADVVHTYAGVRPLYDEERGGNAASISRGYSLQLDRAGAPLLSVLGGKLTTYRTLATETLAELSGPLGIEDADWTGSCALPGGDITDGDFDAFLADVRRRYPWLPDTMTERLTHGYGTRIHRILGDARETEHLGEHFGADLYEAELRYLMQHEWAMTAEDVLWRRTKLGLVLDSTEAARVETWMTGPAGVSEREAASR
ncbi:MAG: glycerol-3-phosphate dehydrogenase [Halofilum sp. (in: g-proteobacteria)]